MAGNISRVTRKGQVTIPIEIRRKLGLQEGDRVQFIHDYGIATIQPVDSDRPNPIMEALDHLPEDSIVRRSMGGLSAYARTRAMNDEDRLIAERAAAAAGWTERERRYLAQRDRNE